LKILTGLNLIKDFGGLRAIQNVSFHIDEGEIVGLIGPNGAGKTTLFNIITGNMKGFAGKIFYRDEDISNYSPYNICQKGITRTHQIVRPFLNLSVLDNVMVGGYNRSTNKTRCLEKSTKILEKIGLHEKKDLLAIDLNVPERKRLELARALATEPKLLLLDETMAGLRGDEIVTMISFLQSLRSEGMTLLIIEHVMKAIMSLSDRVVVLNFGEKIMEGTPQQVAMDEKTIEAYLGKDYEYS
jgi:branched-chain amino acid transport system ATP-binding protein